MKSAEIADINRLYRQCGITEDGNNKLRNTLNSGILNNFINVGNIIKHNAERPHWTNSAMERNAVSSQNMLNE